MEDIIAPLAGARRDALAAIRAVLAADFSCDEGAFDADGVLVTEAHERPGRRHMPLDQIRFATLGRGAVVTCPPEHLPWARTAVTQLDARGVFSPHVIARLVAYAGSFGWDLFGPTVRWACSSDTLRPAAQPAGIEIALVEGAAIAQLYRYEGFRNALGYRLDALQPDVLAAVATAGAEVVGVAGASADAGTLWQIGIDVAPAHQGRGLGRALVRAVTARVIERGRVPFYAAALGNIRSWAVAAALGYWPAWTEMNTRTPG